MNSKNHLDCFGGERREFVERQQMQYKVKNKKTQPTFVDDSIKNNCEELSENERRYIQIDNNPFKIKRKQTVIEDSPRLLCKGTAFTQQLPQS